MNLRHAGESVPTRSIPLRLALACCLALAAVACKDKEPYRGSSVLRKGIPAVDSGPGATAAPPVASAEDVPAPVERPVRPLAVVLTPEGSLLVTARPGGQDLSVRKVAGMLHVGADGTVRSVRAVVDPVQGPPGGKESTFVRLVVRANGGKELDILTGPTHDRPDLRAAARADPDLAKELFHREQLTPVGATGDMEAWVLATEGFLGGAHPYASKVLVTVDVVAGRLADLTPRFQGRDLATEAAGGATGSGDAECVRRLTGIAEVEGPGGAVTWVAGLGHQFESCAGSFRLVPVAPPKGQPPASASTASARNEASSVFTFSAGSLSVPGAGFQSAGVADCRVAAAGDAAVLLMSLGRDDRASAPWAAGRKTADAKSRELRIWEKGMTAPAVVGRASAILAVTFLADRPDADRILKGFQALP